VLHLDLKPAKYAKRPPAFRFLPVLTLFLCFCSFRILFDSHGVTKVVDFGQTRVQKKGQESSDDCEAFGSPIYTAPEIFAGQGASDKSDVYSFGITAWELLSGVRAFKGANPARLRSLRGPISFRLSRADGFFPLLLLLVAGATSLFNLTKDVVSGKRPSWDGVKASEACKQLIEVLA
jgi:serine/threonine protein kinase